MIKPDLRPTFLFSHATPPSSRTSSARRRKRPLALSLNRSSTQFCFSAWKRSRTTTSVNQHPTRTSPNTYKISRCYQRILLHHPSASLLTTSHPQSSDPTLPKSYAYHSSAI